MFICGRPYNIYSSIPLAFYIEHYLLHLFESLFPCKDSEDIEIYNLYQAAARVWFLANDYLHDNNISNWIGTIPKY